MYLIIKAIRTERFEFDGLQDGVDSLDDATECVKFAYGDLASVYTIALHAEALILFFRSLNDARRWNPIMFDNSIATIANATADAMAEVDEVIR